MRSAYALPPWLAADNTPSVKATSGLGTNGGAGVQTPDSGGFGEIRLQFGNAAIGIGGSVTITFPSTPPVLFLSGSEGLGTITQVTSVNDIQISWSGTPNINSKHRLQYEWSNPNQSN